MPRGRPKKSVLPSDAGAGAPTATTPVPAPVVSESVAPVVASMLAIEIPGLPPKKVDGEWNPEYYAALLDFANTRYIDTVLVQGQKSDFNFAQLQKGVLDAARLVGVTEREILDRRTPEQRSEDVLKLLATDPERMFGIKEEDLKAFDRVLETIEQRMDDADRQVKEVLEGILVAEEESRDERQLIGAKGRAVIAENRSPKAWRRRIAQVLRLRQRARMKVPPAGSSIGGGWTGNQYTERDRPGLIVQALQAAHLLRFMIYVGRTGMDTTAQFEQKESVDPADLIFDIGPHHAKFCGTLWCHRTGAKPIYDRDSDKYQFKLGVTPYQGSVQIMPIGHGKTELAIHWTGLEIGLQPRDPGIYLHAVEDIAVQNLAAIKRFFDANDGIGQRYLSLFPLSLAASQNNSKRIRVKVKNPPKSPTWTAAGVGGAKAGIDTDKQVLDDCVPQSDAHEPTERERRFEIVRGTFLSRKRSRKAFTLIIANLWHHADTTMQIIDLAKKAAEGKEGLCYGVCIQRCGGPKATATTKEWQSLWPKMYDTARLKQKYQELGPSMYSAAMMCNPLADEQRIVKKLRLYDPVSDEHQAFLKSSVKYISLDPSATKNSDSDKAGSVYAGFGDVRVERIENGVTITDIEKRVRFIDYHEFHATQSDLTDYTISFALRRPVDYVIVEAVAGFIGIVEMFQNQGIDAIRKDPRGKNKEQRLRAVAPILDDANANQGYRAVAEFPGVRNDKGDLVLDPKFVPLAEQILDFGVCAVDNGLDAVTYLLGELSPDLGIGRGMISQRVQQVQQELGDPRLLAMYKAYERAEKLNTNGTSEEQEDAWMRRNWS